MAKKFKIKKVGSWPSLNSFLSHAKSGFSRSSVDGIEKLAEATLDNIKGHIDKQDLNWAPKKRASKSGSTKSWIDTMELYHSFFIQKQEKKVSIAVKGEKNKLKFLILEHGSVKRNIRPRPVVEVSLKEATQKAQKANGGLTYSLKKFLSRFFQ